MSFDCGGYYNKYDMTKEIHVGTGVVKVHDLFQPLPEFMFDADVVFSDPPYNQSALSSFYTKADLKEKQKFIDFVDVFMKRIFEIMPRFVILETGVPQESIFRDKLEDEYLHIISKDALYYSKDPCKIIIAGNEPLPDVLKNIPDGLNEEKIIEMICRDLDFNCICDPCMGTGLVGWYANKYGKKFVGTELNKKRLALLVEGINIGKKLSK